MVVLQNSTQALRIAFNAIISGHPDTAGMTSGRKAVYATVVIYFFVDGIDILKFACRWVSSGRTKLSFGGFKISLPA
jgi:hypothetical protein